MKGRRYLIRGEPVTVLCGYNGRYKDLPSAPDWLHWLVQPSKCGPRNVMIQHADGRKEIRLFRGLRKISRD